MITSLQALAMGHDRFMGDTEWAMGEILDVQGAPDEQTIAHLAEAARKVEGVSAALERFASVTRRTTSEWVAVITELLERKGLDLEKADHAAREVVQELLNAGVLGGGK